MRRTIALSVHLLLALATPALAAGLLVPRTGEAPIHIRSHRVTAVLEDGIARTTVRQTFVNPHGRPLEAIYLFPLPEGAALRDVSMEVGGKRLEGLLAERKRARRVYDEIVRSRRDPALVEQIGRNKFRLSVFPVLPKVETVVEITYLERVPLERGAFRYVYPLALGAEASQTEEDFTFCLTVKSSVPLERVTGRAPGMEIVRRGPGECVASLERTAARLDRDLVVEAEVAEARPPLVLRTFRGRHGDGWFLLLVTPPSAEAKDFVPRDVILVVDTSGSMEGEKIEQAKASALYLLDNLRTTDRVNVVAFSSSVRAFADAPVPATPENLERLRGFVSEIRATGGTDIGDALQAALDVGKAEGRVRTVVFLTDGRPTLGETRPEGIVKIAKAGGESGLRVFPFGVGSDVDGGLLEGIAEATRGSAEIFRPGGEIETRLKRFLDRTASPVLADLRLEAPGTRDVLPRPLPDVYLGEQMAIVGRYTGGGSRRIVVSATTGTQKTTFSSVEEFRTEPGGSIAVRDLFARAKLDYLERQLRLRAGLADEAYYATLDAGAYSTLDEVVAEIISVSLEHEVQSAYTSFLVLLPEDRHRIDPRDAVALREALDRVREVRGELIDAKQTVAQRDTGGGQLAAGQGPGEEPIDEPDVATEDDVETVELESEDDSVADQPYEGRQSNATIGLGGGPGGAFGGRRGGRGGRPTWRPVRRPGPLGPATVGGPWAADPRTALWRRQVGEPTLRLIELTGLEWLARQQVRDKGFWPAATHRNVGSGVALLAFLGAGCTHQVGPYKKTVSDALKYFKRIQTPSGCFGDPSDLCAHAIATLAMCEAYGMSGSPLLRRPSEKGLEYLVQAMKPATGEDGAQAVRADPSVAVWAALAVASARMAGVEVTEPTMAAARKWLEERSGPSIPAVAGKSPTFVPVTDDALAAAKLFARILLREHPASDPLKGEWRRLMEALPRHASAQPGRRDVGFWYFGALAAFQKGKQEWMRFSRAMESVLVATQLTEGSGMGSWVASGPDAAALGPIGTTALLTMCLEVRYRYRRVFGAR